MQTTEQVLFNNIPEQSKPSKSGFNLNPAAIDQWYDTLPLANIRVSTKSIYQALKETNSYTISYKKRLYLLEKVHEPVTELAANLKKLNLNRELPLDEKHQRISILLHKLHLQVVIGYKTILKELINCSVIFCPGKRKLMTMVIERIIRHNSLSLISNYQFYNAPEKGLWSEIHTLFLLANEEKILTKKVIDSSLSLAKETTIKNVYLQILLVSVADPYRMAQHHTQSIFKQLEEWASLADLHQHDENDSKGCLIIDLSKDTHPAFISPQDSADTEHTWTLDTSKLDYTHLIEHFDGPETQTTEINVELLKQLSLAWGIAPQRLHNRRPAKSKLKVAIGLNNVHFVLNGYRDPEWLQPSEEKNDHQLLLTDEQPDTASFQSRSVESTVKVNDIWGEVFNSKSLLSNKDKDTETATATQPKNISNEPQEWNMVNESIGGYCLLWHNNVSINAKVGEIISISHDEDKKEGYWFVGTIRWMKCIAKDKIQIGVQILAPNAIAISIAKYSNMQEGMKSRAIILPAIPVLKQPKTLITTALGYETRDQAILDEYRLVNANITNVKSKVVLMETLEISSHFTRFKYTLAEDFYGTSKPTAPEEKLQEKTISLDDDTDFDSIWDDI